MEIVGGNDNRVWKTDHKNTGAPRKSPPEHGGRCGRASLMVRNKNKHRQDNSEPQEETVNPDPYFIPAALKTN